MKILCTLLTVVMLSGCDPQLDVNINDPDIRELKMQLAAQQGELEAGFCELVRAGVLPRDYCLEDKQR